MTEQPKRIQRKRAKGWRMPEGSVYCGRPGVLGNPMTLANAIEAGFLPVNPDPAQARAFLADCFLDWLTDAGLRGEREWWYGPESDARKAAIRAKLPDLRGRDLACWCPVHHRCHVDTYLELANR